jgi:hypothetical protein
VDIPRLSGFLEYTGNFLDENLCRRILSVNLVVCLSDLSGFGDENTEVGSHTGIDESDVGTDGGDFLKD